MNIHIQVDPMGLIFLFMIHFQKQFVPNGTLKIIILSETSGVISGRFKLPLALANGN